MGRDSQNTNTLAEHERLFWRLHGAGVMDFQGRHVAFAHRTFQHLVFRRRGPHDEDAPPPRRDWQGRILVIPLIGPTLEEPDEVRATEKPDRQIYLRRFAQTTCVVVVEGPWRTAGACRFVTAHPCKGRKLRPYRKRRLLHKRHRA